jgi:hypothetical protein
MQNPGYGLPGIPLLGDSVNKPARIRLGHEGGLWGSQFCLLALVGLLIFRERIFFYEVRE